MGYSPFRFRSQADHQRVMVPLSLSLKANLDPMVSEYDTFIKSVKSVSQNHDPYQDSLKI